MTDNTLLLITDANEFEISGALTDAGIDGEFRCASGGYALDPEPTEDSPPHYDKVGLAVVVTIDRDTFPADDNAFDAALTVLQDAVQTLNEVYATAHSVTLMQREE